MEYDVTSTRNVIDTTKATRNFLSDDVTSAENSRRDTTTTAKTFPNDSTIYVTKQQAMHGLVTVVAYLRSLPDSDVHVDHMATVSEFIQYHNDSSAEIKLEPQYHPETHDEKESDVDLEANVAKTVLETEVGAEWDAGDTVILSQGQDSDDNGPHEDNKQTIAACTPKNTYFGPLETEEIATVICLDDVSIEEMTEEFQNSPLPPPTSEESLKQWLRKFKVTRQAKRVTAKLVSHRGLLYIRTTKLLKPNSQLLLQNVTPRIEPLRDFYCEVCDKQLKSLASLNYHKQKHSGDARRHSCHICGKSFGQVSGLKAHMYTHSSQKPFQCHVCGQSFTQLGNLRVHARVHDETNPKLYSCEPCGKDFAHHSSLAAHRASQHSMSRPHQCSVCGKSYHRADVLRHHMKLHNAQQHRCSTCGKTFTQKSYLRAHLETHSGTQHVCGQCGKIFSRAETLKRHVNSAHQQLVARKFQCEYCDKSFTRAAHVTRHVKKIHADQGVAMEVVVPLGVDEANMDIIESIENYPTIQHGDIQNLIQYV